MADIQHRDIPPAETHAPYSWHPETAAARGAIAVSAADVGKLARQLDDETVWRLVSADPAAWAPFGAEAVSADDGNALTRGGDGGLYVPDDIPADPLAYYILARS